MNDKVKIALIAAVTAVGITWMVMYFSPYRTCVRAAASFISENIVVERTQAEVSRLAQMQCAGAE